MNDYIKTMRRLIGHETLLTVGCGAIIENSEGKLLLQRRVGDEVWGIPGGILEIGETFEETVRREVAEETNLQIRDLEIFGIYSGANGFARYSNGDKVFSVQIIFKATVFEGNLRKNGESTELRYVGKDELPDTLNRHQTPFILDWRDEKPFPVIK